MPHVLSENTLEALHHAAFEVLVRGVGASGEYDYKVSDCLLVGAALDKKEVGVGWLNSLPNSAVQAENLLKSMLNRTIAVPNRKRGW